MNIIKKMILTISLGLFFNLTANAQSVDRATNDEINLDDISMNYYRYNYGYNLDCINNPDDPNCTAYPNSIYPNDGYYGSDYGYGYSGRDWRGRGGRDGHSGHEHRGHGR